MNKNIIIVLVLLTVLLTSCSSGRISLIDLDLRNPEQIRAYTEEANAPYQTSNNTNDTNEVIVTPKFEPTQKSWYWMFDFLKVMQGRFKVLSFEWKK